MQYGAHLSRTPVQESMVAPQYMENAERDPPYPIAGESILKARWARRNGVLEAIAPSTSWVGELLLLSLLDIADFDAHANCQLNLVPSCTCKPA